MELVVEPSAVSDTGAALRSIARGWPEVRRTAPGSSGSLAVDETVADFLATVHDGVWAAGSAVHDLGTGAVDASASFVATDRHLRLEAR